MSRSDGHSLPAFQSRVRDGVCRRGNFSAAVPRPAAGQRSLWFPCPTSQSHPCYLYCPARRRIPGCQWHLCCLYCLCCQCCQCCQCCRCFRYFRCCLCSQSRRFHQRDQEPQRQQALWALAGRRQQESGAAAVPESGWKASWCVLSWPQPSGAERLREANASANGKHRLQASAIM